MRRAAYEESSRLFAPPARLSLAAAEACRDALLEQRRRPESFAIGVLQDFLRLHAQRGSDGIHELERPEGMTQT